jgi:hypothetical protein
MITLPLLSPMYNLLFEDLKLLPKIVFFEIVILVQTSKSIMQNPEKYFREITRFVNNSFVLVYKKNSEKAFACIPRGVGYCWVPSGGGLAP